jgi:putative toxin-antitoxin system antitoxin component (TIGR02293 family)
MVEIHEPIGALHRLVVSGLPIVVARELIETVADTPDVQDTLIDAAAPSLRTASPGGRLTLAESDRLLQVGRLFTILEAAFGGAAEARDRLRLPLKPLGNRSPLERSGSVTGLEHACALLVPQGIVVRLEPVEVASA